MLKVHSSLALKSASTCQPARMGGLAYTMARRTFTSLVTPKSRLNLEGRESAFGNSLVTARRLQHALEAGKPGNPRYAGASQSAWVWVIRRPIDGRQRLDGCGCFNI